MLTAIGWLLTWAPLVVIGGTLLLTIAILLRFYWFNYATIVQDDLIMIRRMTNWRTARCYKWDKYQKRRAFMQLMLWKDELTVERSEEQGNPHVPLWVIHHFDLWTKHEIIISVYLNGDAEVRERKGSAYWASIPMKKHELFLDQKHMELIRRAEVLQKELEKKIKAVLKDR
ncbi:hypothetical protein KGO95_04245 [Patescibacteria group bacterium]|nr:hypothetical protein [Patescibacteria group bacterium]